MMDKTGSGSSRGSQGHSIYVLEDEKHQPSYSAFSLMENYCNSQQVDVLAHHLSSNQSSNSSSDEQNSRRFSLMHSIQNVAPRVHINPNFRPKTTSGIEKCSSVSHPSRVHINPHWRGRVETAPETTLKPLEKQVDVTCSRSSAKKTIFVNPKVLPHLRLKCNSYSKVNDISSRHQVTCSQTQSVENDIFFTNLEGNNSNCLQRNIQILEPGKEPLKNKLKMDSSTKLVSKPDQIVSQKSSWRSTSDQYPLLSSSVQPKTDEMCKSRPGLFNTRVPKQTSSKYKLVRNSSSSSKVIRGSPANSFKKTRKRTENIPISTSKSIYKYVRNVSSSNSIPSQSDSRHVKCTSEISSSDAERICELRNINMKKNVKSQNKPTKILHCHQYPDALQHSASKPKTVHTRYKLIRTSSSSKLSAKRNVAVKKLFSVVPGFPLQSPFISSRFKISRTSLGTGINLARRVSRFRIVSSSSNSKPQAKSLQSRMKSYRAEQSLNLLNCRSSKLRLYGNISWQNQKASSSTKSVIKLPPPSRASHINKQKNVVTSIKSNNRSLINIGGVLYCSTRTSLTRTQQKDSKERVLNIRGKRFVLDDKGTTLRPKHDPAENSSKLRSSISRIDIGGVTFTRRSDNTLVRTNTHFARSLLSFSKMKSIAFLRGKHRKINQPCLIYQRFGKCHAHEASKCWRVHNPKNISICRKFLQGNCEAENCLLSHDVGPEKMPTCHYFLEGCCVRDNCPYSHVKLSAHAAICREFLNGYCATGDMCKKRHIFICPDFEQHGECSKGKYCPYPHRTTPKISNQNELRNSSVKSCRKIKADKVGKVRGTDTMTPGIRDAEKRKRYYDESKKQTLDAKNSDQVASENDSAFSDEDSDQKEEKAVARIRTKIGILPAYIPLE